MNAIHIYLKLESPVLLDAIGSGEENSSCTLSYIPGATLRGALISRYQSGHPGDLLQDQKAIRLFFSGLVQYLNGYPSPDGCARALPTPRSWRTVKGVSLAELPLCGDLAMGADVKQLDTPVSQRFCLLDGRQAVVFSPEQTIAVHIASEGRGVVRKSASTVFQYQALAAGQTFSSVILAETANDMLEIRKFINEGDLLRIGRSRYAEYGQVRILKLADQVDWREVEGSQLKDTLTLTLLSDTILQDANGQPTLDMDGEISRRLGNIPVHNRAAFLETVLVSGFNRKWRLPLPQTPAIAMGSVFVYDPAQVEPARLANIAAEGLGIRRIDGFGRAVVNWPAAKQLDLCALPKTQPKPDPQLVKLCSSSQRLALTMANRLLIQKLDERLLEKTQHMQIDGRLSNHQLARMRTLVRHCLIEQNPDPKVIQIFIKNLRETARQQLERARFQPGNIPFNYWLQDRVTQLDGLAQISFSEQDLPVIAGQKAVSDNLLQKVYTLRLIEAVVHWKMIHNRQGGEE